MKYANEYAVSGQVSSLHLMWRDDNGDWDHVGRIDFVFPSAKYTRCVATTRVWNCTADHPLYTPNAVEMDANIATGDASGYGYCKRSAAIYHSMLKLKTCHLWHDECLAGSGVNSIVKKLELMGYKVIGDH